MTEPRNRVVQIALYRDSPEYARARSIGVWLPTGDLGETHLAARDGLHVTARIYWIRR